MEEKGLMRTPQVLPNFSPKLNALYPQAIV